MVSLEKTGPPLNMKMSSYPNRNSHIKIGRSDDSLIFIMRIPIPRKTVFILRRDRGGVTKRPHSQIRPGDRPQVDVDRTLFRPIDI